MTFEPLRPSPPGLRVPPVVWDIAAALVVLLSAAGRFPESPADRTTLGWIVSVLPALLVLVRRRFAWPVLIACVACFCVAMVSFPLTPGSTFASVIALYTVTLQKERKAAAWALAGSVAVMTLVALLWRPDMRVPAVFEVVVTMCLAFAVGDATRSRRAYVEGIVQRAITAEQTREAEASRRVVEDRLRIARDLHDAVAHQISVISLNAGVASSAIDDRPEVAREALSTIRTASRAVLGEIGDLLATLRLPEDQAERSPAVGLAGLDELVAGFEDSGLHVTVRREGSLDDLPTSLDVVAYRVIQEGLTNVLKHGIERRAHLLLRADADQLAIIVSNPVDPGGETRSDGGHGLRGIRERVDALHGTIDAGRTGGTFRLAITLPCGRSSNEKVSA
ncbi:histidine kinase [Microbacterium sp. BWT-B31]|uniref:sensor histidine kinase n=1 Tax=Microbacterium sp. BWT-B31 TaxID=3232072 RepID=UPI003528A78E